MASSFQAARRRGISGETSPEREAIRDAFFASSSSIMAAAMIWRGLSAENAGRLGRSRKTTARAIRRNPIRGDAPDDAALRLRPADTHACETEFGNEGWDGRRFVLTALVADGALWLLKMQEGRAPNQGPAPPYPYDESELQRWGATLADYLAVVFGLKVPFRKGSPKTSLYSLRILN